MPNLVVGPPEDPAFPPLPPIPTIPPAVPGVNVLFSKDIQTVKDGTSIAASNTGSWAGSVYGGIADALVKFFGLFKSPSLGYARQAYYGESAMDFNGYGGLTAGFTGVGRGFGKIGTATGAMNDVCGINGVAFKDTNCWAAGLHGEVRDSVSGGVAIGLNGEIASLKEGTRGIGVNAMNWAGNAKAESAFNGLGEFHHGINLEGVQGMSKLFMLAGNNPVWIYDPTPPKPLGKLAITIDGQTFYIPVCN